MSKYHESRTDKNKKCNSRNMSCPLRGQYLRNNIYRAGMETYKEQTFYTGSTETNWKHRFYKHRLSLGKDRYKIIVSSLNITSNWKMGDLYQIIGIYRHDTWDFECCEFMKMNICMYVPVEIPVLYVWSPPRY